MKRLILIAMVVMLSAPNVFAQNFCQGDFNYNGSVGAEDVSVFLEHFGRSQFNNPCPPDGPALVPKTGQTTSWATGDDGDLEKGVAWPNPRFADNADGTVTDNQTGLIWLKDAYCFYPSRGWSQALSDCNELFSDICELTDGSQAGDWRLPNRFELESLLDLENVNPALPSGHPFANVQLDNFYWSSTHYAGTSTWVWVVSMYSGYVGWDDVVFDRFVWCVRGGH